MGPGMFWDGPLEARDENIRNHEPEAASPKLWGCSQGSPLYASPSGSQKSSMREGVSI